MDVYAQMAVKIIQQQEDIIGPVAIEQAELVPEIDLDWSKHQVDISGNPATAIDDLVAQYSELFGPIAVQVSKDAAAEYLAELPENKKPKSLL